ncbi:MULTISPECIES: stage V sporulation protein AA [unclassified Paenibacillus]|uniref:stage V sporulation protein AA n=1 Tax=unclassified Paenibacillus TaxID=185978 RepID=UPI001AE57483|nr:MULTISPECIES: stage V sporulation protein AA [unclassified Paenibacillus]MBP1155186.1 stage V sporulation protein AA [Paenibacillus sp. PvP091]MBP1169430.1 stage V sporulation protein AA [Paenibacillus sp. PvR098]MBP2440458.1 stage V sporulation protein AA [Paenibacillus sp. PvP052]
MQRASVPSLYIRLRKKMRVSRGEPVYLGQIAQLLTEPEYEHKLQMLELYRPHENDGSVVLVDMMLIVRKVKELYPSMQIEHFGEPHALIEIHGRTKPPSVLLIVLVWLLLFVGSGLAIMNFHADVSMAEVHQHIYKLLTGKQTEHPLLLQIPYSIGIGLGMITFFNHLFKKKFNEEPSPLEVEMFMYQENVNQYVITEEYGKIQEKKREEGETSHRDP